MFHVVHLSQGGVMVSGTCRAADGLTWCAVTDCHALEKLSLNWFLVL